MMARRDTAVPVTAMTAQAYRVPTDAPEADGTLAWTGTSLVVVHVEAGGETGFGYSYASDTAAVLIAGKMAEAIAGLDAMAPGRAWMILREKMRNLGQPGIAATALSAVDVALWDLKAKLLGVPLATLLGQVRPGVAVYGSGGFTSYDDGRLAEQLSGWAAEGFMAVKMKVGSQPADDPRRVRAARRAVGEDVQLFVDGNGAYTAKQALKMAELFAVEGVAWFEEPVSSDALAAMALVRARGPAGMDVAAGEYGWSVLDFRRLLEHGAVDVLQADATRCGGVTGFLQADALCEAFDVPLSAHCAPSLHAPLCCVAGRARHLEWFHDHVRIERLLFDGFIEAEAGICRPPLDRPGLGLALKDADAEAYAV